MIKVYYDDRCNLCSREIDYYKKISNPKLINWCKISQHTNELEEHGISIVDGLERLHAVNSDEKQYHGVDAFILIWQHLPGWKWLAVFTNLPVIYPLSKIVYNAFAKWRFNRLTHCVIERNRSA